MGLNHNTARASNYSEEPKDTVRIEELKDTARSSKIQQGAHKYGVVPFALSPFVRVIFEPFFSV